MGSGHDLYDHTGAKRGQIQGNRIYGDYGEQVGYLEGGSLRGDRYEVHNAYGAKVGEIRRSGDWGEIAGGAAFLFLMFLLAIWWLAGHLARQLSTNWLRERRVAFWFYIGLGALLAISCYGTTIAIAALFRKELWSVRAAWNRALLMWVGTCFVVITAIVVVASITSSPASPARAHSSAVPPRAESGEAAATGFFQAWSAGNVQQMMTYLRPHPFNPRSEAAMYARSQNAISKCQSVPHTVDSRSVTYSNTGTTYEYVTFIFEEPCGIWGIENTPIDRLLFTVWKGYVISVEPPDADQPG